MTTKEAIAYLKHSCRFQKYVAGTMRLKDVEEIISALLDSQKREREVFKRLSRRCEEQVGGGKLCTMDRGNAVPCTMRTCPLLKEIK